MFQHRRLFVALHWITAVIIIMQISMGNIMSTSLHTVLGFAVGLLMLARLFIRFCNRNAHSVSNRKISYIAQLVHRAIYGFVGAIVLSGIALLFVENETRDVVLDWHALLIDSILLLIGLHILATVYHLLIKKASLWRGSL